MAIDDNTIYGLYGSQIKDLPGKIEAIKGLAKELTSADYNWPENDPDGIALWKLPKGMYYTGPNVKKYISTSRSVESSRTILIGAQNDTNSAIYLLADGNSSSYKFMERYIVNYTTGTEGAIYTYALTDKDIVDNLTSTDTTKVLSANQGKVLKDLIDSLAIRGAGAPTTSTVGQVGTLYEDTTNGNLYICTDATGGTYTWEEVGAGGSGGGVIELTSADYNYDYGSTGTNNCIALWLLSEGTYSWATTLRSSVRVTTTVTAGDLSADGALVIAASDANLAKVYLYGDGSATTVTGRNILQMYRVNKTNGTSNVSGAAITTRELKQSTGNSESDVMSQKATTWMVYNGGNSTKVQIGANSAAPQNWSVAILGATSQESTIAIGTAASATARGAIALGVGANASTQGVFDVGLSNASSSIQSNNGYNGSAYRLLTGIYDPQSAHDAATKGYVDTAVAGAGAAAFTTNEWNALWA